MKKIKNNLARFLAMVILFSFAQSQGKNDKDTINPTNAINYVGKVKTVCIFYFSANYTKLHNNVGVSFINKKAPVRRLFDPEAFHLFLINTKN